MCIISPKLCMEYQPDPIKIFHNSFHISYTMFKILSLSFLVTCLLYHFPVSISCISGPFFLLSLSTRNERVDINLTNCYLLIRGSKHSLLFLFCTILYFNFNFINQVYLLCNYQKHQYHDKTSNFVDIRNWSFEIKFVLAIKTNFS